MYNPVLKTYKYEALNNLGKPIKGSVDAFNQDDAIKQVRDKGQFPTSVRQEEKQSSLPDDWAKVLVDSAYKNRKKRKGISATLADYAKVSQDIESKRIIAYIVIVMVVYFLGLISGAFLHFLIG
tara:strand:- start:694 stop:1065 length:372 start_codon:yes stop_codon:yes gene_type:complete